MLIITNLIYKFILNIFQTYSLNSKNIIDQRRKELNRANNRFNLNANSCSSSFEDFADLTKPNVISQSKQKLNDQCLGNSLGYYTNENFSSSSSSNNICVKVK